MPGLRGRQVGKSVLINITVGIVLLSLILIIVFTKWQKMDSWFLWIMMFKAERYKEMAREFWSHHRRIAGGFSNLLASRQKIQDEAMTDIQNRTRRISVKAQRAMEGVKDGVKKSESK